MRSFSSKLTRRTALKTGGLMLAGLWTRAPKTFALDPPLVEIRMQSDVGGGHVVFDPVGVWMMPGTKVRWIVESNVHTTTAYHPDNDLHSLRIPQRATPWDSGYLVNSGDSFEVMLTEEGVYDYYCAPHEIAGMVGRIIVARPTGPGALPFDYFAKDPAKRHWKAVPPQARAVLPTIEQIMAERVVRASS